MTPKYTQLQFNNAKSKDLLPLKCECCNNTFYKTKHSVQGMLNPDSKSKGDACSKECKYKLLTKMLQLKCTSCNKLLNKNPSQIERSSNHFCSQSCAATFNNKNKTFGIRRSKLEKWIEEQLTILYPNLKVEYNSKSVIKSELDIYISSLNLAFELNGIFHYEPIYGANKLSKIKANDISKTKERHKAKIDLCIIDTSNHTYITPKSSQKYLDIIIKIINERV